MRHEDFVADPERVVRQILDCCRLLGLQPPDFTLQLTVGVPLQGNRVTRSQTLRLKGGADSPRAAGADGCAASAADGRALATAARG